MRIYEEHRAADAGKIVRRIYGVVVFDTIHRKQTYRLDGMPVDEIATMRVVLGDRVHG